MGTLAPARWEKTFVTPRQAFVSFHCGGTVMMTTLAHMICVMESAVAAIHLTVSSVMTATPAHKRTNASRDFVRGLISTSALKSALENPLRNVLMMMSAQTTFATQHLAVSTK